MYFTNCQSFLLIRLNYFIPRGKWKTKLSRDYRNSDISMMLVLMCTVNNIFFWGILWYSLSFPILTLILHFCLSYVCFLSFIPMSFHAHFYTGFLQQMLLMLILFLIISKWLLLYGDVKGHLIFSPSLSLSLSPNTYLCLPWPELWAVSMATFTTLGDSNSQSASSPLLLSSAHSSFPCVLSTTTLLSICRAWQGEKIFIP